jgi:DNA-binding transcriptional MerR regulator
VHINTVRRWTNTGLIKHYRLGPRKDRRFTKADILEFLDRYLEVRTLCTSSWRERV